MTSDSDGGRWDDPRELGATLAYRQSRKLIQLNTAAMTENTGGDILSQTDKSQLKNRFLKLFAIFKDEVKEEIRNELREDEPKRKKKAVKSNTAKTLQ